MSLPFAFLGVLFSSLVLHRPESACAGPGVTGSKGDYVVLLHGYGRTAFSMKRLEWYFNSHGYRVINTSYPSTQLSVEALSEIWLRELLEKHVVDPSAKVHFVTHSLGGIIVRQYLANNNLDHLGRVVMLAPPNQGSEIVDHLKTNPTFRSFAGQSLLQLGTSPNDLPHQLGPAHFEVGIIAGKCSFNPLLSSLLSGPNDGKLTVESTKLNGMTDFLAAPGTHTWLMWRHRTLQQARNFLESGHFVHEPSRATKAGAVNLPPSPLD